MNTCYDQDLGSILGSPINALSSQKKSDNFDEILQEKAKLGKYLKEKRYSVHYQ